MKKHEFRRFIDYGILALALALIVQIGLLIPKVTTTMAGGNDWGLSFSEEGAQPRGNADPEDLAQYDAFFMGSADQKILYLTFDCGYENGNTAAILDTLKSQQVPAAFFVTGHYLEQSPDLIARMVQEGHIVGNHTYSHPNMSKISTNEHKIKKGLWPLFYFVSSPSALCIKVSVLTPLGRLYRPSCHRQSGSFVM